MRYVSCLLALSLTGFAAPASALVESPLESQPILALSAPALAAWRAPEFAPRAPQEAAPTQERGQDIVRSAVYGPFQVIDRGTAALVGATDARSPAAFRAMLEDHPHIASLMFIECPGTYDDRANLEVGRLIRAAGLAAHVPEGGSVRSGAVELVLAGTSVTIEDGAEFAVHAWEDQDGLEANDYAADSIENRKYLAYYREMGMSAETAETFYAMTNSVPFESPLWLGGAEMRGWVRASPAFAPRLAYLDLGLALY